MKKLTEEIKNKINQCSHHTTVILIDREHKMVIGNVCDIHSMKPIADIKDDIWNLCNWGCWNGTFQYENTYNEEKDDEYRMNEDGDIIMIPLEKDYGFVDHNIVFIDNDEPNDVKFWVAQAIDWTTVDTIAQAFNIEPI